MLSVERKRQWKMSSKVRHDRSSVTQSHVVSLLKSHSVVPQSSGFVAIWGHATFLYSCPRGKQLDPALSWEHVFLAACLFPLCAVHLASERDEVMLVVHLS